ncbi:ribulose-phosphate 3-epimerase [Spirochaetia bacterium]|nr:ribulose-phosphate 3-epimerase [Spirochaetia bacterium]
MRAKYTLGASVSCFDLFNLEKQFAEIHGAPIDFLHYDVVDGSFNQCIILGLPLLAAIRPHTKLPIDVHLAVYQPERFIEQFAEAGADIISIHPEGTDDVLGNFERIRKLHRIPALALRSETEVTRDLLPALEQAEFITKLTVNPGFSGQKIQPQAFARMSALRKLMDDNDIHTPIAADGNVNVTTIPALVSSGASMLIGGTSGLFLKDHPVKENAQRMLLAMG